MLERLSIQNYKLFHRFVVELGQTNLFTGPNGIGKSAVFEVLDSLRQTIVEHSAVAEVFPESSRPAGSEDANQRFELTVSLDDPAESFQYVLAFEHSRRSEQPRARIVLEELLAGAERRPLFRFVNGEVQLFRDDYSEGPTFPLDWSRSALATVPERDENSRLQRFRRWVDGVWVVRLDPASMDELAPREIQRPATSFRDFASWLRHCLNERPGEYAALKQSLPDVLEGFSDLSLKQRGESARTLKVAFDHVKGDLGFSQLSDGQRALIALSALRHYGSPGIRLLCLDEPDNYLALAEIQPLIYELVDWAEEDGPQLLVVSHHPELLDHFAFERKLRFCREGDIRASSLEPSRDLAPSEAIARGWEDD